MANLTDRGASVKLAAKGNLECEPPPECCLSSPFRRGYTNPDRAVRAQGNPAGSICPSLGDWHEVKGYAPRLIGMRCLARDHEAFTSFEQSLACCFTEEDSHRLQSTGCRVVP